MGFLKADPQVQVNVVASGLGRGQYAGRQIPKMRAWILEDKNVVVITPAADGKNIERTTYPIDSGTWMRRDQKMVLNLVGIDNEVSPMLIDMKGCGCGFGAVANTGPVDGPHFISTVRSPDWFVEE